MDLRLILFLLYWKVAFIYGDTDSSNPCTKPHSKALPNPRSCHKYIMCQRGKPVEFNCPYDWRFDSLSAVCKPPGRVTCHPRPVTKAPSRRSLPPVPTTTPLTPVTCPPQPTTSTTSKSTTTEHSTSEPSTTEHSTSKHSTSKHSTTEHSTSESSTTEYSTTEQSTTEHSLTEHSITEPSTTEHSTPESSTTEPSTSTPEASTTEHSTKEPCIDGGLLPDPTECRYFYIICEGSSNIREKCPFDLLFDPILLVCLPPGIAQCNDTTSTTTPSTTTRSTTKSSTTTPSTTEHSTKAPCIDGGLLPDPTDCRYFYIICEGSSNIRENCPFDLLFDPILLVCLPPGIAQCNDTTSTTSSTTEHTTSEHSTSESSTTEYSTTEQSTTEHSMTEHSNSTTEASTTEHSTKEPCIDGGLLPDLTDCRYFYIICEGSTNIREKCPFDLLFDPILLVCLPPGIAQCNDTTSTTTPSTTEHTTSEHSTSESSTTEYSTTEQSTTEHSTPEASTTEHSTKAPCIDGGLLPDPTDCRYFYIICEGSTNIREKCPYDLLFDPILLVCLPSGIAQCNDITSTTSRTTTSSTTEHSTTEHATSEHSTSESSTTEYSTTEQSTPEASTTEHSTKAPCIDGGLLPDPTDCRYFYIICEGSTNIREKCPYDLLFDPILLVCLPPRIAQCNVTTSTTSRTTPFSTTEHSTTEHTTSEHSTSESATTEYSTTEQSTTEHSMTEHSNSTTEASTTEHSTKEPCIDGGLLPDLTDCRYFYIICEGSTNIREKCPFDLLFDPILLVCLPPGIAQCNDTTSTTSSTTTPSKTEHTTSEHSTSESSTTEYSTTERSTTEHSTTEHSTTEYSTSITEASTTEYSTKKPCIDGGLLPDLTDCRYFYIICEGSTNIREKCPFDLLFDPILLVCLPPGIAQCNDTTSTTSSTTTSSTTEHSTTEHATSEHSTSESSTTEYSTTEQPTTEHSTPEASTTEHSTKAPCIDGGLLPDPTDCRYFYIICEGSTNIREKCPYDLLFDPILLVCLPPRIAQCNVTTSTTSRTTPFSTTEHSTTEHTTSEHSTSESSTTEYSTTEQSTTEHSMTEHSNSTTEASTTEHSTKEPCIDGGLLPDLTDCRYFYIICEGSTNIREKCPFDLLFDPILLVCLPPGIAQCNDTTSTTSSTTTSSTTEHSTTEHTTSEHSTSESSTTEYSTTEQPTTEHSTPEASTTEHSTKAPCIDGGLLPDPTDCRYFYIICEGSTNIREKCPFDLLFDPILLDCLPPGIAQCNNTTSTTSTTTTDSTTTSSTTEHSTKVPCIVAGLLPDPTDCRYYYVICEGTPNVRERCPFDLLFDPILLDCLPPGIAQCNDTTSTTSSTTTASTTTASTTTSSTTTPSTTTSSTTTTSTTTSSTTTPSTTTSSTMTPTTKSPDIKCKFINDYHYLPDPTDCTYYYVCIYGVAYRKKCPYDFYFSENYQMCLPPSMAECNKTTTLPPKTTTVHPKPKNITTTSPAPTTSHSTSTTTATPTTSTSTKTSPTTSPTTTSKPNPHCINKELIPDPLSCRHYYLCKHDRFVRRECASDYEFSPELLICLPPYLAHCKKTITSTATPSTTTPSTTTHSTTTVTPTTSPTTTSKPNPHCINKELIPDPLSCRHYYLCKHDRFVRRECPSDYEFSPELLLCLPPYLAHCEKTTTSTTTHSTTTVTPTTSLTTTSKPNPHCINKELIPDPLSCRHYYLCKYDRFVRRKCPSNYEFSPELLVCLPPYLAHCKKTTTSTATPSTTTQSTTTPSTTTHSTKTPSTTTHNPTTSTKFPPHPTPCHVSGVSPDPLDCRYYYVECRNGTILHLKCQEGFLFSPVLKICLPVAFVDCDTKTTTIKPVKTTTSPRTTTSSTHEPTTSSTHRPTTSSTHEPTTSSTHEPTTSSTHEPTTSSTHEPTTSSTHEPTTSSTVHPTTPHVPKCTMSDEKPIYYIPDPTSCRSYYICYYGDIYHEFCPKDYDFSPIYLMCLPPEQAQCLITTTPPVTECVTDPDDSVYYYPDANNCHHYYLSYHGKVIHQTCPNNYVFDPTFLVQKCVPPSEYMCKDEH